MTRRIDYADPAVIADARRKLAEMYAKSDTAGRTEIGRKLGYSGKPANIRRSVRRLSRFQIGIGEKDDITGYFRPYVTIDEPEPWLGALPPYTVSGRVQITSFVMLLIRVETEDGYVFLDTRTSFINTATYTSLRPVFEDFNRRTERLFYNEDEYEGLEAIAFSEAGIEALLDRPEYDTAVPPREDPSNYGIALTSTKHEWVQKTVEGKKKWVQQPLTPPTATGRPFPKKRRKDQPTQEEMIRYIRRAHPRRVK